MPTQGTARVLLVEDEILILMALALHLQSAGFDVIEAHGSSDAFQILQSRARLDLMVTDVNMPGPMNGIDLVDQARKLRPEMKVIMASAKDYRSEAEVRNVSFFAKPYAVKAVASEITRLLQEPAPTRDGAQFAKRANPKVNLD